MLKLLGRVCHLFKFHKTRDINLYSCAQRYPDDKKKIYQLARYYTRKKKCKVNSLIDNIDTMFLVTCLEI
jgi:hypothetical protein